jgi:hypothetical protein
MNIEEKLLILVNHSIQIKTFLVHWIIVCHIAIQVNYFMSYRILIFISICIGKAFCRALFNPGSYKRVGLVFHVENKRTIIFWVEVIIVFKKLRV